MEFLYLITIIFVVFVISNLASRIKKLEQRLVITEEGKIQAQNEKIIASRRSSFRELTPELNKTLMPEIKEDISQRELSPVAKVMNYSQSQMHPAYQEMQREKPKPAADYIPTSLEQLLGGKLLLWVGALAMFLAGIFLVNYWIDQGYISPAVRMVAAACLGGGLYALSWPLSRQLQTSLPDIVATIGVAILYAVILASRFHYQWLGAEITFAFLLSANALLFIRAFTSDMRIGYLGVILSYLTPILVQSPDNDYIVLNGYLLLLSATLTFISISKSNRGYMRLALIGHSIWSLLLITFVSVDGITHQANFWSYLFVLGLFGFGYLRAQDTSRYAARHSLHVLTFLALIAAWVYGSNMDYSPIFWIAQGIILMSGIWIEQRRNEPAPFVLGIIFTTIIGILSGYYWGIGQYLLASGLLLGSSLIAALPKSHAPRNAAIAAVCSSLLIWLASFFQEIMWPITLQQNMAFIMLQAACVILAIWQMFRLRNSQYHYAVWSSVFCVVIGATLATVLDDYWWALALSVTAIMTALFGKHSNYPVHYKQLIVISLIVFATGLIQACQHLLAPYGLDHSLLFAPFFWMIAPALILFALHQDLAQRESYQTYLPQMRSALLLLGFSGVLWQGHAVIRYFMTGPFSGSDIYHIGTLLSISMAYIWFTGRLNASHDAKDIMWRTLSIIVLFFAVLIPGFTSNPWLDAVAVGDVPVFNALWLLYALPGLFMGLLSYQLVPENAYRIGTIMRGIGLFYIWMLVISLIAQYFHGSIFYASDTDDLELYSYSIGTGLYGILLLAVGIVKQRKILRIAALLILTATSLKVFLWDLASLVGTYRFLSFFALGATLITIGYIYQKTNIGGRTED